MMTEDQDTTAADPRLERPTDLAGVVDELLRAAGDSPSGRAARTLLPGSGSPLKQTVLALAADRALQEHVAPGPASLLVLRGTVVLRCAGEEQEVGEGSWIPIPRDPHDVTARTDAAFLISVSPGTPAG